MKEISVHDNFVTGYSVQTEEKIIKLHTEYRDEGEPYEKTDVVFEGVEGYLFLDSLGSILFGIDEVDISFIIEHYQNEFKRGGS
ncbi:MAG: hypothetical protein V6Z89_18485 [Desulfobacter sp.]